MSGNGDIISGETAIRASAGNRPEGGIYMEIQLPDKVHKIIETLAAAGYEAYAVAVFVIPLWGEYPMTGILPLLQGQRRRNAFFPEPSIPGSGTVPLRL